MSTLVNQAQAEIAESELEECKHLRLGMYSKDILFSSDCHLTPYFGSRQWTIVADAADLTVLNFSKRFIVLHLSSLANNA